MSDTPRRLENLRQIISILFVVGAVVGVGIIVLAIWQTVYLSLRGTLATMVHIPAFLAFLGILTIVASVVARASVSVLFKIEGNLFHSHDVLLDIQELLRTQNARLAEIAENVQLSDATKSIARREKRRKALHDAIQEEILRGNWDAAYYLVDELEKRYGYRNEATHLREEVDDWRGRAKEQRLLQGLKQTEAAINRSDWREATRWHRRWSRSSRTTIGRGDSSSGSVTPSAGASNTCWQPGRRAYAITRPKRAWNCSRNWITTSQPEEAQSLREPVRNLFKERLQGLGSQFAAAYKEKDWDTALSAAERIQLEFPTSKMAEEVRSLIRNIKEQADTQPAAS